MYKGTEHFISNGTDLDLTLTDFWRWAYSDFANNMQRGPLAEFIVASALGITDIPTEQQRIQFRPFDFLTPEGLRLEVKCASYVQSWECRHPDHVSYSIAPAQMPDPELGYVDGAPKQRNSDCYIFCLYKATSAEQNPLDLNLWEFFILKTAVLDSERPTQKSITLPSLLQLGPVTCTYVNMRESLQEAMKRCS